MDPMQQFPPGFASAPPRKSWYKKLANPRLLRIGIAGSVALLFVAVALIWKSNATPAINSEVPSATVIIGPGGFSPATLKVKKGSDVAWVNQNEQAHQIAADQTKAFGLESIEPLSQGDAYIFTFDQAGTFRYYDPLAPAEYQGTIIVE